MKVKVFLAWYDLWIGAYWNTNKRTLYVCLLPMIVIAFSKSKKKMFSAWDKQCNKYFYSGRNSDTEEQCRKEILEYLAEGEEELLQKLPGDKGFQDGMLSAFEVEIHEQ